MPGRRSTRSCRANRARRASARPARPARAAAGRGRARRRRRPRPAGRPVTPPVRRDAAAGWSSASAAAARWARRRRRRASPRRRAPAAAAPAPARRAAPPRRRRARRSPAAGGSRSRSRLRGRARAGLDGAELALERDAGVDGVAVEQVVRVVAQAGAGKVGHAPVEPARRGDGGAELGERRPAWPAAPRRRPRSSRGRRCRRRAPRDRWSARFAPEADVLAGGGVGALDGAQVEHRRAAAGEGVGGGGVGGGSNVERAVQPHDLPRGGGQGQTEDQEKNRPDDAGSHPSIDAGTITRSSKKWRLLPEHSSIPVLLPMVLREVLRECSESDQKLNWRRDHQRTLWRGWSSPIGISRLLWTRSCGVTK